jgi:hypothetical protein
MIKSTAYLLAEVHHLPSTHPQQPGAEMSLLLDHRQKCYLVLYMIRTWLGLFLLRNTGAPDRRFRRHNRRSHPDPSPTQSLHTGSDRSTSLTLLFLKIILNLASFITLFCGFRRFLGRGFGRFSVQGGSNG